MPRCLSRIAVVVAGIHSPGYDLLLIAHVACALFGFGALAATGVQAARLAPGRRSRDHPGPPPLLRSRGQLGRPAPLRGARSSASRCIADSAGRFGIDDGWVLAGLLLWLGAATVAEGVLWPAERRIQRCLAGADPVGGASGKLRRDGLVVAAGGAGLAVVFVGATVVMVARP